MNIIEYDRMNLKYKTSHLYSLCAKLFPNEFNKMFTAKREEFRDWLNQKTGLSENHITDKECAIQHWIDALEFMSKNGVQKDVD